MRHVGKHFWATALLGLSLAFSASAQTMGDDQYKPTVGQSGKDVVWVPTPDQLIDKMLRTAQVTDKDLVYDLGAGDGKIAIAAALNHGARAVGIEFNPEMAALAQRNVERAGLKDKVRIIRGDIFVEDFSSATVVTLYLLPQLNLRLKPILQKMKPGTRVVSNSFNMDDWTPDENIDSDRGRGYFWIIPARIEGQWSVQLGGQTGQLRLEQKDQMFNGSLSVQGASYKVEKGRLRGTEFSFEYQRGDGSVAKVTGNVDAGRLQAQQQVLSASVPLTAQKQ